MIKLDRFALSKRPYAVKLDSMRFDSRVGSLGNSYLVSFDAVWFRRRSRQGEMTTVACIGWLDHYLHDPAPVDGADALRRFDDGRYGGRCLGRWDGRGYWGDERRDEREAHLAILVPMLASYPDAPPSFDGWWTFLTG